MPGSTGDFSLARLRGLEILTNHAETLLRIGFQGLEKRVARAYAENMIVLSMFFVDFY
jgi:hypothetical protein